MDIHVIIKVTGRVQGVFFRASAARAAEALGINGFVQNQQDGSVYLEAEGPEASVLSFIQWCRKGPPGARVETCETTAGGVRNYKKFEIRK